MAESQGTRWWALAGVAAGALLALGLAHAVAAQPWDSSASAACSDLSAQHVAAQMDYLTAGLTNDSPEGQLRDTTFAELGVACGWEEAQAADMAAYVQVLESAGSLPGATTS